MILKKYYVAKILIHDSIGRFIEKLLTLFLCMPEINIPNLNRRSDKYLFKKKLTLRRKSKRKLLVESLLMLICSIILIYINYLIPNKKILFLSLLSNLEKSFTILLDLFSHLYSILLVVLTLVSLILSFVFFLGFIYRLSKVVTKKSKQFSFK